MKLKVYAIKDSEEAVIYRVVQDPTKKITLVAKTGKGYEHFQGAASHLQMWAAKRDLPYEEITLNIPVELFNGVR